MRFQTADFRGIVLPEPKPAVERTLVDLHDALADALPGTRVERCGTMVCLDVDMVADSVAIFSTFLLVLPIDSAVSAASFEASFPEIAPAYGSPLRVLWSCGRRLAGFFPAMCFQTQELPMNGRER